MLTIVVGYVQASSPKLVPFGRLAFSVYLAQLIPMAYDLTCTYVRVPINRITMVSSFL